MPLTHNPAKPRTPREKDTKEAQFADWSSHNLLPRHFQNTTKEQLSSSSKAKRASRLKLVLAWSVVLLPLAWGLYETGRSVIPLIRTLRHEF
ncbi:MFS transporter small subunit [Granulicella mallensis]